jgi:hypothetical protein
MRDRLAGRGGAHGFGCIPAVPVGIMLVCLVALDVDNAVDQVGTDGEPGPLADQGADGFAELILLVTREGCNLSARP